MARTVLPWESVPGPHYAACDPLQRKEWVKYGGWLLVAGLILGGAVTRFKVAYVFALLYTLTLLMKKDVAVTRRGLEVFHRMQITTNYERWDWGDVSAVTYEPDPKDGARTLLYFTKGDRTRRAAFSRADASAILRLAKAQNPEVRLYDGLKTRGKMAAARKKKP
jgi:hypothetical protein